jgi:hypothetical protein
MILVAGRHAKNLAQKRVPKNNQVKSQERPAGRNYNATFG